jgi:hypothetical protein
MADPVTLALGGGMAVFGAASSASQASTANANARRQAQAASQQGAANALLNDQAVQSEINKLSRQFNQYLKSADASAGVRGVAGSAASEALRRASMAASFQDVTNIQRQGATQEVAIWANTQNQINAARASMQNPWLSGISGGLQGLQSGLALGSALNQAGAFTSGASGGLGGMGSFSGTANPSGFSSPTSQSIGGFRYA